MVDFQTKKFTDSLNKKKISSNLYEGISRISKTPKKLRKEKEQFTPTETCPDGAASFKS